MSRETVRMVRDGVRPPAGMFDGEQSRDELLARIAMLEKDLAIANKALAQLLAPKAGQGTYDSPWPDDDGDVFMTWEDEA